MKLCKDCRHFWREGIAGFYCLSPHNDAHPHIGITIPNLCSLMRLPTAECGKSAELFEPREE